MSVFDELGDGIFRRRYESMDLNIGVVIGAEAVLIVDSRETHRQADVLRDELCTLTRLPVGWVVNTHYHWDHTWGNARFPEAALWGHDKCRRVMLENEDEARQSAIDWLPAEYHSDINEVVITPPEHTFTGTTAINLGNRTVGLSYHGLGHTNSDIVIRADDVLFAGDLVEESGPPFFGDGFPLDWGPTLTAMDVPDVVVPGHGDTVDAAFITTQSEEIEGVALLAREGHTDGASISDLVSRGPYPAEVMHSALTRAYAQLNGEL